MEGITQNMTQMYAPVGRNDAVSLHDLLLADGRLVGIATFRTRNLKALPLGRGLEAAVEKYFSTFFKKRDFLIVRRLIA